MKYPVLIRVDGNAPIGMGHITRCQVLANALQERGLAPALFLTRDYTAGVEFLKSRGLHYEVLSPELSAEAECAQVRDVADRIQAKVVIIDLLDTDQTLVDACCPDWVVPVVLLDHLDPPMIRRGLVFNHNVVWNDSRHPARSLPNYFGGAQYVLLDPVFAKNARTYPFSERVRRLFLNQGGGDPFNLTTKILRAIVPMRDQIEVDVVLGGAFAFEKDLASVLELWGERAQVHRMVPPAQLVALMTRAQMAHTAPGNMIYELLTLGIASIAISHHEKHAAVAEYFASRNALVHLGIGNEIGESAILEGTENLLEDAERRRGLHETGRRLVDGLGAGTIAEILVSAVQSGRA